MPEDLSSGDDAVVPDRAGLLIIRVWIEEGSSESLRANVRVANDVSAGFDREVTLTQPSTVCTTVAEWLAAFTGQAERRSELSKGDR